MAAVHAVPLAASLLPGVRFPPPWAGLRSRGILPPSRRILKGLSIPVGAYDRLFYGGMAIAMALTAFTGFAPTYYLRFLGDGPSATLSGGPFTPLVHLRGALFTGWVLLFVVQTALVASRRVAVHRRLGLAGAVLAAAMVLVGTGQVVATALDSPPAGA